MARQTRETLKNYFRSGNLPTEEAFEDLIDSSLNMGDEGYSKTPENGVEILALGHSRSLVSFYAPSDKATVQWALGFRRETDQAASKRRGLVFSVPSIQGTAGSGASAKEMDGDDGACVLALEPPNEARQTTGRVGIGTDNPHETLDVNGVVRSRGRIGGYIDFETKPILADGGWHAVTPPLEGCQAFEVMAGVRGKSKSGKFALLHAFALNTFNSKRGWFRRLWPDQRIRTHEAFYENRCDRLELQWNNSVDVAGKYQLEIRSHCEYGTGSDCPRIQCFITELWFDHAMEGAWPKQPSA